MERDRAVTRVGRSISRRTRSTTQPLALRLDKCSELTSTAFTEWCSRCAIKLRFTQRGKPDQNAFIERFNKTYRNEVLDAYVFELN
jgi:putative transposase